MAGISTGISLLGCGRGVPVWAYPTTTLTSATRDATASPNPDYYGNTGYDSASSGKLSYIGTDSRISAGYIPSLSLYPNCRMTFRMKPEYFGNVVSTITPVFKDTQGIECVSSGSFTLDLTRSFCWGLPELPMPTSITRVASDNTQTCGIIFDTLDNMHVVYIDDYTVSSYQHANRQYVTTPANIQSCGLYNEVKFENLSGDTAWSVTAAGSLSDVRSKNTYYDISNSAIRCTPRVTSGSNVNGIRVTFRNKANTAITFTQDITLTVTRT